jgi:membrane protein involved in colicin uptake
LNKAWGNRGENKVKVKAKAKAKAKAKVKVKDKAEAEAEAKVKAESIGQTVGPDRRRSLRRAESDRG